MTSFSGILCDNVSHLALLATSTNLDGVLYCILYLELRCRSSSPLNTRTSKKRQAGRAGVSSRWESTPHPLRGGSSSCGFSRTKIAYHATGCKG